MLPKALRPLRHLQFLLLLDFHHRYRLRPHQGPLDLHRLHRRLLLRHLIHPRHPLSRRGLRVLHLYRRVLIGFHRHPTVLRLRLPHHQCLMLAAQRYFLARYSWCLFLLAVVAILLFKDTVAHLNSLFQSIHHVY